MDEEIAIINEKTRNEKIKIFLIKNKRLFISTIAIIILTVLGFYSYKIFKDSHRMQLSDKYNIAIINHKNGDKFKTTSSLKEIVKNKDSTYSPLALYYLIDNNLVQDNDEINVLFDVLINETNLETEIKNLIIYKKALFNADFIEENELLKVLNPLLNSDSIWKSHALYLIAEYFFSKNEKQKSKEFYNQIISLENANQGLRIQAQKRLNRDLSE